VRTTEFVLGAVGLGILAASLILELVFRGVQVAYRWCADCAIFFPF